MMNLLALWILVSTLGAANVGFPEHLPVKTSSGQHLLEEAKVAAKESLQYASEAVVQDSEGIRHKLSSASHIPGKAADAVQLFAVDVAKVVKDCSQSGLEKIGLARREEPRSREDKQFSEVVKEHAVNAHDMTKDAAGDTVQTVEDSTRHAAEAVQDRAVGIGEWLKRGVQATHKLVEDDIFAGKTKVRNTAGFAQEKVSERVHMAGDSALHIAQSVQKSFSAAESKAAETIRHVSEQAADIVRNKATTAASVLPNLGQGLAYRTLDTHDEDTAGERVAVEGMEEPDFLSKGSDLVEGAHDTTGNFRKVANEKSSQADETVQETKDAVVDGASDNAGESLYPTDCTRHKPDNQPSDRRVQTSPKLLDTDSLKENTAFGPYILTSETPTLFEKLRSTTATYLLSSCRAAHLFAFSSVYGSSLWVTFLSGFFLSRSIPRQQFGFVQSRIFPAFLRLAGCGQAVCIVLFLILHPWSEAGRDEKFQHLDLWTILMSTLVNVYFLEPQASKAMFQKLEMEKEEGRGQGGLTSSEDGETKARVATIDIKFAAWHGYSSIANFLSLLGMTWHLWHLSRRLVV